VCSPPGGVELDADEEAFADEPLEVRCLVSIHVDVRVSSVGEVSLGAMRVDPADVVRAQAARPDLDPRSGIWFSVLPGAAGPGARANAAPLMPREVAPISAQRKLVLEAEACR